MEHSKENHKDKVYHCPYGDFRSQNHSAVLLHFDLSSHASLASPEVEAVEVVKFENKSYGQDNMLDLQRTSQGRLSLGELGELEVLEEQLLPVKEDLLIKQEKSENYLLDQNPAVRKKAGRATNIFSTTYKSKEEKECQGGIQSRAFVNTLIFWVE